MDPAYIEILDTNKELRKELAEEIANNTVILPIKNLMLSPES